MDSPEPNFCFLGNITHGLNIFPCSPEVSWQDEQVQVLQLLVAVEPPPGVEEGVLQQVLTGGELC